MTPTHGLLWGWDGVISINGGHSTWHFVPEKTNASLHYFFSLVLSLSVCGRCGRCAARTPRGFLPRVCVHQLSVCLHSQQPEPTLCGREPEGLEIYILLGVIPTQ